jgi:small Trp-rich protein
MSLLGLLTVLFVGLKLAGVGAVATWSWFWVLSPTLIPLLVICVLVVLGLIATAILGK